MDIPYNLAPLVRREGTQFSIPLLFSAEIESLTAHRTLWRGIDTLLATREGTPLPTPARPRAPIAVRWSSSTPKSPRQLPMS